MNNIVLLVGRQLSSSHILDSQAEIEKNRPHCRDRVHTALIVILGVAVIALSVSHAFLFTQMRQLQDGVTTLNSLSKSEGRKGK